MWDPDAIDYDCDIFVPLPTEILAIANENTNETISPKKKIEVIGRGIPINGLVTERPAIRRPAHTPPVQVTKKWSNEDEITVC
jgi:hypothetical protein